MQTYAYRNDIKPDFYQGLQKNGFFRCTLRGKQGIDKILSTLFNDSSTLFRIDHEADEAQSKLPVSCIWWNSQTVNHWGPFFSDPFSGF